jgi:hypothetical protein
MLEREEFQAESFRLRSGQKDQNAGFVAPSSPQKMLSLRKKWLAFFLNPTRHSYDSSLKRSNITISHQKN